METKIQQKQMYFITLKRPEANSCNKSQRTPSFNDKRANWLQECSTSKHLCTYRRRKKHIMRIYEQTWREIDNTITAGISTLLSTMDRAASKKAGKETLHLNYAWDQMRLRDIPSNSSKAHTLLKGAQNLLQDIIW